MKLECPYPPGVNSLYGVRATLVKGHPIAFPYKTHEHRDYATAVKLAALEAGFRGDVPMFPKPATVALLVRLFRPRRAGDIDGPLKTLLDVLQGIAFENDDQVARLEVYRHDDKHRPRVELEVTELAAEQPALDLGFTPPVAPMSATPPKHARPVSNSSEPLAQRLRRLATPAHVDHRGDE